MVDVKKILLYSSAVLFTCSPFQQVFSGPLVAEAYESRRVDRIEIQAENLPTGSSFNARPVLEKLKTKVGDPFSQLVFDTDLKALSEEYDRIEPQIEVRNGEVFVTIKVWLRPAIRTISWQGNTHIKSSTLEKSSASSRVKLSTALSSTRSLTKSKNTTLKKGILNLSSPIRSSKSQARMRSTLK